MLILISFQIQLHSQSQEKVFPHEKAQLKLNFDILQSRFQRYQQEQVKVSVLVNLTNRETEIETETEKALETETETEKALETDLPGLFIA